MGDDFSFLKAIFKQPDDDLLRLVYADWLDERADPRGAFVRLDVASRRPENAVKDRQVDCQRQLFALAALLDAGWVNLLRRPHAVSPGTRLDLADMADGRGRIEVRGGSDDTLLLVEGRPVALNWNDCAGSIGQYLVYTGHARGVDHARQLAAVVEWGVDADRSLADQIGPLLAEFAAGLYCLEYTPAAVVPVMGLPRPGLIEYYPDDRNLVYTQPPESRDAGRVTFFRGRIRAGGRPVVLTAAAAGAWCEFVIDGHHKLEAYDRERTPPAILAVVRWQAPAVGLADGLGCFSGRRQAGAAAYRRMKT